MPGHWKVTRREGFVEEDQIRRPSPGGQRWSQTTAGTGEGRGTWPHSVTCRELSGKESVKEEGDQGSLVCVFL